MAYTYDELKHKTVAELREIAAGLDQEAVKGYTQLNKEHLLELLVKVLKVPMHARHEVVGIDKTAVKREIRELKRRRAEALAAHDHESLRQIRRRIHRLKHVLRRATR